MELHYKASQIAKSERESGKKLFSVLSGIGSDMSFDDILFLFLAGSASEDDFDNFIAEKGVGEAMILVVEGLSNSGFLGKESPDTQKLRENMAKARVEALQNTGESKSA